MTEQQQLLRAIHANPADDTVRLAYADFLAENGDETRAEFIRVQIALANCVPPEHKKTGYLDQPVVMTAHGDRHYSFTGYTSDNLQVEDRVDILIHRALKTPWKMHGLRVYKIEPVTTGDHLQGELKVYVRLDDQSKPWAGTELRKQSAAVLKKHGRTWLPYAMFANEEINPTHPLNTMLDIHRGFARELTMMCEPFLGHAGVAELFTDHPIEKVTLAGVQPYQADEGWLWDRYESDRPTRVHDLPHALFDELRCSKVNRDESHDEADPTGYPYVTYLQSGKPAGLLYLTPGRAWTALSRAAVRYGYKQARIEVST